MTDTSPIFVIGYMASGKTTFGRALARRLGRDFIDLDFYISQRYRMPVPRIFAEKGEEEFRRMEGSMLREAGEFENVVISCGGGTPCFGDNIGYMNSRGLTLRLHAGVERTVERLLRARGRRPVTDAVAPADLPAFVKGHLAEREPFYSQARMTINGDNLENIREIDATVDDFLEKYTNFVKN